MKLDATDLRYVTNEEFRVLTAVEMGSKNHEVVPNSLIAQIAGLRHGGVNKALGSLAKRNLVAKVQNSKYDGYRLTYGGYDYLAMRALSKRDSMYSVGNQIGVGKESDIYVVSDAEGNEMVLKLHRLGRISFRAIKEKRDYMGKRKSASWMYMSRLAAQKEWEFMKVLHEHKFPVPRPVDHARHCILMEKIDAFPLRQVSEVPSPGKLYSRLMDIIVRFANAGLIHGDYNEFNILIRRDSGEPVVIDFPQMVSTSHENAEWYFNRDVECIRTFFRRRFRYESMLYPRFRTVMKEADGSEGAFQLDVMVAASGFGKKEMRSLEEYMNVVRDEKPGDDSEGDESDEEEGEDESGDDDEDDGSEQPDSQDEQGESAAGDGVVENQPHDPLEEGPSNHADVGQTESPTRSRAPSPTDSLTAHTSALQLRSPTKDSHQTEGDGEDENSENDDGDENGDESPGNAVPAKLSRDAIRERITSDISRQRARQTNKYHSKRSTRRVGRPKGSKAKQDTRVKIDRSGVWD